MEQITLNAQSRKVLGKLNNTQRKQGKLPGVIYGHEVKSTNVELDEREFKKIFKQAGESSIVNLKLDGQTYPVLIQDVQNHFLNDKPIHVDFYAVNMKETLKATVPITFIGEAPAVKALGGTLVKNLSEVEVECLPMDLPREFVVDVGSLITFEDAIRVTDLKISEKVKVLAKPDEMIVTTEAPRSEEELKALEEKPVAEDVTKVEGVVKPEAEAEGDDKDKKEKPEKVEKAKE